MNCARHLARRYGASASDSSDDLEQVAYLELVKAVDQFDPERGVGFLAYSTPMILGEIRRHFRDGTWAVHVPRRMQELSGAIYKPRTSCAEAYRAASLDRQIGREEDSASFGELIGHDDPGFDAAMHREVLRALVAELPEHDKRILLMRFFRGMTQQEIGREIGTSETQVSRILSKIIGRLREGFFTEERTRSAIWGSGRIVVV